MRFLHLADTHLGFHQYQLSARNDDFNNVFLEAAQIAVNKNCDFVLLPGDLFNTKKPSYSTLEMVYKFIDILKIKNIKLYGSTGNHCHTSGMNWTDFYNYFNSNIIDGVHIDRVNWSANPMSQVYNLPDVDNGKFNILMLHHGTTRYYGVLTDDDICGIIDKGYDYTALGHIHVPYIEKNKLFNPGSLEYTSSDLWGNPGGVFVVDINADKSIKYRHIKTTHRPCYRHEVVCDSLITMSEGRSVLGSVEIPKDSLVEILIKTEVVSPNILPDLEEELKGDSLRVKIKYELVDTEKEVLPTNEIDAYKSVYGDYSELAKKVIESSKDIQEVLELL